MHAYKGVRGILEHNTKVLHAASTREKIEILDLEFTRFEKAEERRAKRTGEEKQLRYRLHWSGDVMDNSYAHALAEAMKRHPLIQFWSYTRSFKAAKYLLEAPNLVLYFSLDPVNVEQGIKAYIELRGAKYRNLACCYMSKTKQDIEPARWAHLVDKVFNSMTPAQRAESDANTVLELRAYSWRDCPVDTGKLELARGCHNCQACLNAKPVWFAT
jgi:hypothetical protein